MQIGSRGLRLDMRSPIPGSAGGLTRFRLATLFVSLDETKVPEVGTQDGYRVVPGGRQVQSSLILD